VASTAATAAAWATTVRCNDSDGNTNNGVGIALVVEDDAAVGDDGKRTDMDDAKDDVGRESACTHEPLATLAENDNVRTDGTSLGGGEADKGAAY
jgi:hypothetical protein